MSDYRALEQKIQSVLGGTRRPVAIAFTDAAPQGVARFEGSEPSSCSFWRIAAGGRTFYTVPSNHVNCPVGGYTHNALSEDHVPELHQVLGLMSEIGYIRLEEVPAKTIVYSPLADAPVAPTVVLAAGKPAAVMMLAEAAHRAGAMSKLPLLGRPTCMAIPAALEAGAVTSTGCIGNRVYTDIGEDELYVVLRGSDLERIGNEIDTIIKANQALTDYHRERRRTLTASA